MIPPVLFVTIELENPTLETQTVLLDKGRCFEILNPSDGLQNAALAEDVQVILPPKSQTRVEVPAFCLNRYRGMNGQREADVTPFVLSYYSDDQEDVWERMARPAA